MGSASPPEPTPSAKPLGMTRETLEAESQHVMSEKKRTRVTTIETHEVWIVRRGPSDASEIELLTPDPIATPQRIPSLPELHDVLEANESSNEPEP